MRDESETATLFLERLTKAVRQNARNWKIIVPLTAKDDTANALRSFGVEVIDVPPGLGLAYRVGLTRAIEYPGPVITMDTDLSHLPEEISRLIAMDSDIVLGARDASGAPLHRRLTSYVVNNVLRGPFTDYTSSYRLYQKAVLQAVLPEVRSDGFAFLPEIVFRAMNMGFSVSEVLVSFQARIAGQSKMSYRASLTDYLRFLRWRYSL